MICPVCKCGMIVVEYHNIELDYCTGCKGVWFDSGELDSPETISSEKKRKCPICGYKMKKTNLGEKPKILIDLCSEEHGLWFDGGEITQLIRHLAGEHPPKRDAGEQVISFLEEVFEAPE